MSIAATINPVTVLTTRRVVTMDPQRPTAEVVAVSGGQDRLTMQAIDGKATLTALAEMPH